jgi:short-subunit dehydrogenase
MTSINKALVIGVGPEKGLGASIAARFAREGLHVFVAGRTAQSLEALVQKIRSAGGTATAVVWNSAKAALRNLAQAMAKELGPKGLHVGMWWSMAASTATSCARGGPRWSRDSERSG